MNAALVAGWLAAASPAACPPASRVDVTVTAEAEPPVIRSSHGLDRLREHSPLDGFKGWHAPLGYYAGVFGYTVEVTADPTAAPGCVPALSVAVRPSLAGRVVEIGSDLHATGAGPRRCCPTTSCTRDRTSGCWSSTRAGRSPHSPGHRLRTCSGRAARGLRP